MTEPRKLRDDAIVEALCQVHFSAAAELPEVVLGRLSDLGTDSAGFTVQRLPLSDMPATLRRAEPNLRFQPLLELRNRGGDQVIRIGDSVLSAHCVGASKYPGWDAFKPQLIKVFTQLFTKIRDASVHNISLRYINALVPARHLIREVHELRLGVTLADEPFKGPMNLNLFEQHTARHSVTTRIAHPQFVQGLLPDGTAAIVDVEVITPRGYSSKTADAVFEWVEEAHAIEKTAFFRLFPRDLLARITVE